MGKNNWNAAGTGEKVGSTDFRIYGLALLATPMSVQNQERLKFEFLFEVILDSNYNKNSTKMFGDIVNGAQLPLFMNKKVTVTGFVTEKAPKGLWFEMRTSDNQIVRITMMNRPIDEPLDGYVEVHGTSTGKGVNADDYIRFDNEKFDAKGHSTLCQLLNSVPNLWNLE